MGLCKRQYCAKFNSKWLNASTLKQLARGLGTPCYATLSDLRTLIEKKIVEVGKNQK